MNNRLNNLSKEELIECIKKQEKQIEKLTDEVLSKNYELRDRIDKAIEYIKTHSNCGGSVQEGKFIIEHIEEIYDGMKLIEILRGDNNGN